MIMKKFSIIILVLSFLMTFTQCKKKDLQIATVSDAVYITLDIENNSKVNVNTANGEVKFEKYDVIYAVSGGKYVGSLMHNGELFCGSITGAVEDEPLMFYFFGNQKVDDLVEGETTSCSVNISDQTGKLPVISCGPSNETFSTDNTSYTAVLLNKCALVKFNVSTTSVDEPICLSGMNNVVEVNFSKMSFSYSQEDGGVIKMAAGSGEHWAILLPNDESMDEGAVGTAYSADYRYLGCRPAMDAVYVNDFITNAYNISVEAVNESDGMFSMSTEKRIVFAPGNVQYICSEGEPYWRFAKHQFDVLKNVNEQKYGDANVDRDRFGWGTANMPYQVSQKNSDYPAFDEWGDKLGMEGGYKWHTPRCYEWKYVLYERNATKLNGVYNARYARARIALGKNEEDREYVNGLIIFPDVYNHPEDVDLPAKESINYTTNNQHYGYAENTYTVEKWEKMEAAGAVFLPAAGQRIYTDGNLGFTEVGEGGHYWSQCTFHDGLACNMFFTEYRPYMFDDNDRYKGFSVRLVHE